MIENKILPTARSHLTIQNSPFKIHHSKFTIRNSPFEIHHSKFKIQNSKFPPALPSLSHSKSKIQHLFLLLLLPIQNSKSFSTSPSSHSKFKIFFYFSFFPFKIQNSKFKILTAFPCQRQGFATGRVLRGERCLFHAAPQRVPRPPQTRCRPHRNARPHRRPHRAGRRLQPDPQRLWKSANSFLDFHFLTTYPAACPRLTSSK